MENTSYNTLLLHAVHAALQGATEILAVYEGHIEVDYKSDNSPLTEADRRAHLQIAAGLGILDIPILSEEGRDIPYSERREWERLWIVDPLDGTKEFVKRNGEFTVNIALCEQQIPTLGVIYVPVQEVLYFGAPGLGAFRKKVPPSARFDSFEALLHDAQQLPETQDRPYIMVGSRSHMSDETSAYFQEVLKQHPEASVLSKGSSLKICMVAEGSADVYPRFAPTMEWDTAAGHALAKQAGFEVINPGTGEPLQYNKADLLNPWFVVK
jgi:3'(2'), 5'-bisphosphate nucleotidase